MRAPPVAKNSLKCCMPNNWTNPSRQSTVTADNEIKYDLVLQTMDLLVRNKVENVGLLALPKS